MSDDERLELVELRQIVAEQDDRIARLELHLEISAVMFDRWPGIWKAEWEKARVEILSGRLDPDDDNPEDAPT